MCVSPLSIVYNGKGSKTVVRGKDKSIGLRTYLVPCGKCSECLKKKATSWGIRAYRESRECITNHFVTLTYDREHVPVTSKGNLTLDRSACRVFIKRLRSYMWYHYENRFRFFCSAEYGSKTFRPHYHFLFHGLPSCLTLGEIKDICLELWRQCSVVDVQYPKNGSSGGFYVGKYCGKSVQFRVDALAKEDDEFVRPFKRASVGYGNTFTKGEKDYYLAKDFQDEYGVNHDVCAFDSSDFERYAKLLDLSPDMPGYGKFCASLTRYRDPNTFLKWIDVVTQRYCECHRPKKDGTFVNIKFPEYLAVKLYGEDLYKVVKRRVQFLQEQHRLLLTDGFSALTPNTWANAKLKAYFEQVRLSDFDCFLASEYDREFRSSTLRVWRERDNMIQMYINDVF